MKIRTPSLEDEDEAIVLREDRIGRSLLALRIVIALVLEFCS
jgi:hypothetical protein